MSIAGQPRGRPADPDLAPQFIRAALEIVTEHGYSGLTTAAVAKRVGASTASLYRRWPTKRELVVDAARSLTFEAIGDIDTGALPSDLRVLLARKDRLLDEVGPAVLALMAEAHHDPELRDVLRHTVLDDTTHHVRTILERAAGRAEIPRSSEATVAALGSVLVGAALVQRTLTKDDPVSMEDAAKKGELALILATVGYSEDSS